MHDLLRHDRTGGYPAAAGGHRKRLMNRLQLAIGPAVMGDKMDQQAVEAEDTATGSAAQLRRARGDCVEGRLHVGRRAGDNAEDFRRGRLLLQSFARLGDQPRVLDRDDRLVGKGAHQLDLPLGERLDPLPGKSDRAEHGSLAQQRHAKHRASP